ncbi:BQ5605_C010g05950 [Microbotryum silenes-dioicae]|uniref:BQ5605_C010g05950 protein n=1 Tax=Microbotryum silenes-dioicae TaxID=796604 RepID=A0A2X0LQ37_9BASI|nr:BQ5605_C010g05950 [Microbotryum silenes-dioicae]
MQPHLRDFYQNNNPQLQQYDACQYGDVLPFYAKPTPIQLPAHPNPTLLPAPPPFDLDFDYLRSTNGGSLSGTDPILDGLRPAAPSSASSGRARDRARVTVRGGSPPASSSADWPPVPDLIPDSPSSFSPPPPKTFLVPPPPSSTSSSSSRPGPGPRPRSSFVHPAVAGAQAVAVMAPPQQQPQQPPAAPDSLARNDFRSASVPPLGEIPKPRRRRTQEWSEQGSFVSSVYAPNAPALVAAAVASVTAAPSSSSSSLHPQLPGFAPVGTLPYTFSQLGSASTFTPSPTEEAGQSSFYAPSVDHPLSLHEQQDLLDRVKRDLNGVDLDSIKGPLRALALSGGPSTHDLAPPNQIMTMNDLSPHRGTRLVSKPLSSTRDDEMARKTVSPQEAFLDYEDVDHRLHAKSRLGNNISSSFGLGVGASLFAPLPTVASSVPRPASSPVTGSRSAEGAPTSPHTSPPSVTSLPSTSPRHNQGFALFPRKPHPFAVPQNAVSWAERQAGHESNDAADDYERESSDGDGDGDVEGDKNLQPSNRAGEFGSGTIAGKQPARSAAAELFDSDEDDRHSLPSVYARSTGGSDHEVVGHFDDDEASIGQDKPGTVPKAVKATIDETLHSTSTLTDRPVSLGTASVSSTPPPPPSALTNEATSSIPAPALAWAKPPPHPMRSSSQRTLETLQPAPVGGDDIADALGEMDTVNDAPSPGNGRGSISAQQKRSRSPAAEEDDMEDAEGDDDDDESVDDASFQDSDGSTKKPPRAPTKRGRASAAPHKRRRRVPSARIPSAASTTATTSSSLACSHKMPDGSICGVVFRRPYDLARHRGTIHGEGGKAGKKHDWICKQCGGSFSRKDALIRHGRIRNHKAGL